MRLLAFFMGGFAVAHCASTCSPGQVTGDSNLCIQPTYIPGCNKYATATTCKTCDYRYKLSGSGLCTFDSSTLEPCCAVFGSNGKCNVCNTGLFLNADGHCVQKEVPGCLEKNSEGVCVNCSSEFILQKDGTCKLGIKNCSSYLAGDDLFCKDCEEGFSLINNACLKNKILGCVGYKNDATCSSCQDPFTIKNGHCEVSRCVSYNDYGCIACDCGFYLSEQNKCEPMETGCIRYQRGKCIDCQSIFRLRGAHCEIEGCNKMEGSACSECDASKYLLKTDGGCQMKNCLLWKNGACTACEKDYYVIEGQCQRLATNSLRVEA